MSELKTVDEILDFAIGEEEAAADFYTKMSARVDKQWMKDVFAGFAKEELGHKAKLVDIKSGKKLFPAEKKVLDLKIGDYLVDLEVSDSMDYQDALVVAMKKEKAAFRLYNDLAATTDDEGLKGVLLSLAQEEAKHKLRFEVEYDEYVLTEN